MFLVMEKVQYESVTIKYWFKEFQRGWKSVCGVDNHVAKFQNDPTNFLCRFVTVHETGSPLFVPDKAAVKTVDLSWIIGTKECQNSFICWKGYGYWFFGGTQNNTDKLSWKK